jgi:hypothetical protein
MDWASEAYGRWLRPIDVKTKKRRRRRPGILDCIRGLLGDVSGQQWLCVALVSIAYNCLPFRVGLFVVPLASVVASWGQRAPTSGLLLAAASALLVRLFVVASNAVIELGVLTCVSAIALAAVRCKRWGVWTHHLGSLFAQPSDIVAAQSR